MNVHETSEGYFLFWRDWFNDTIFADAEMWRLFTWCVSRANHAERLVPLPIRRTYQYVLVKPGEFIFGKKSSARELGWKVTTIYDRMKKLEKLGHITLRPDPNYTLVTLCDWLKWQPAPKKTRTQSDPNPTPKNKEPFTYENELTSEDCDLSESDTDNTRQVSVPLKAGYLHSDQQLN
jgi:hypothetical protein